MQSRHLPTVIIGLTKVHSFMDLSSEVGIAPSTLSRCLKALSENGIVRSRCHRDGTGRTGKRRRYELTSKGDRMAKKARLLEKKERLFWERLRSD